MNSTARRFLGVVVLLVATINLIFITIESKAQLVWNSLICSNNLSINSMFVESEYYFTNMGSTAVRVLGASSDCGCLLIDRPKNPIEPGKYGKVVLKMDVANEAGLIKKTAHIVTDCPYGGVFIITNVAKIPETIVFNPSSLIFSLTNIVEQMVIISNTVSEPITIQGLTYDCAIEKPVRVMLDQLVQNRILSLRVIPPPSDTAYTITVAVLIQYRNSGIEKNYRLPVKVE